MDLQPIPLYFRLGLTSPPPCLPQIPPHTPPKLAFKAGGRGEGKGAASPPQGEDRPLPPPATCPAPLRRGGDTKEPPPAPHAPLPLTPFPAPFPAPGPGGGAVLPPDGKAAAARPHLHGPDPQPPALPEGEGPRGGEAGTPGLPGAVRPRGEVGVLHPGGAGDAPRRFAARRRVPELPRSSDCSRGAGSCQPAPPVLPPQREALTPALLGLGGQAEPGACL